MDAYSAIKDYIVEEQAGGSDDQDCVLDDTEEILTAKAVPVMTISLKKGASSNAHNAKKPVSYNARPIINEAGACFNFLCSPHNFQLHSSRLKSSDFKHKLQDKGATVPLDEQKSMSYNDFAFFESPKC